MYKHILIATDGSQPSKKAVDHGVKLAKTVGAPVTMVTVTELWSALAMSAGLEAGMASPIEEFERSAARTAGKTLASAAKVAERAGVTCKSEHVPDRRPSEGIVETARKRKCDLIVMGSHGRRGLDRLLLGSQASEVLRASKVPVLVVR
jgi:nucleotide-binding universal stress UspA family protein